MEHIHVVKRDAVWRKNSLWKIPLVKETAQERIFSLVKLFFVSTVKEKDLDGRKDFYFEKDLLVEILKTYIQRLKEITTEALAIHQNKKHIQPDKVFNY